MRNIAIHEYGQLDLRNVWDVVRNHIPAERPGVEQALRDQEAREKDV